MRISAQVVSLVRHVSSKAQPGPDMVTRADNYHNLHQQSIAYQQIYNENVHLNAEIRKLQTENERLRAVIQCVADEFVEGVNGNAENRAMEVDSGRQLLLLKFAWIGITWPSQAPQTSVAFTLSRISSGISSGQRIHLMGIRLKANAANLHPEGMVVVYQVDLNGMMQALIEPIQCTLDGDYISLEGRPVELHQLQASYQIGLTFGLNPTKEHFWFHYEPKAQGVNGIIVQPLDHVYVGTGNKSWYAESLGSTIISHLAFGVQ